MAGDLSTIVACGDRQALLNGQSELPLVLGDAYIYLKRFWPPTSGGCLPTNFLAWQDLQIPKLASSHPEESLSPPCHTLECFSLRTTTLESQLILSAYRAVIFCRLQLGRS